MFIEHPLWAISGAVIGVVGIVISILQLLSGSGYTPAALEVAIVTLGAPQEVDATLVRPGSNGIPTTIAASTLDITLKNNGDKPSLITQANAEVLSFEQLDSCQASDANSGIVSGRFAIELPTVSNGHQVAPEMYPTSMRFEVKPGAVDRMSLTLGPREVASATTVMAVHLTLTHDDSQTLDVGTVLVAVTRKDAGALGGLELDRTCAARNLQVLNDLYAIQGHRAPELDRMRRQYQQVAP